MKTRTQIIFASVALAILILAIAGPIVIIRFLAKHSNSPSTAEDKKAEEFSAALIAGIELSPEEAANLEQALKTDSGNISNRTKLISFYWWNRSSLNDSKRADLTSWLVQNAPDSQVAGVSYSRFDSAVETRVYQRIKDLWLRQIDLHPKNVSVLENAASFFSRRDRSLAIQLCQNAQAVEPDNYKIAQRAGSLFLFDATGSSGADSVQAAIESLKHYKLSLDILERRGWYRDFSFPRDKDSEIKILKGYLAEAAYFTGIDAEVQRYVNDLLKLAEDDNDANDLHKAYTLLGLVAVRHSDLSLANSYLIKSAQVPTSPALGSFGPSMSLAKALLEHDQRQTVLHYLDLCEVIWVHHIERIKDWKETIGTGGTPDFGSNLKY